MGMTNVLSMKGAPRIAPNPTSTSARLAPKKMAIIGIDVSGSVVPMAANTPPTAPSDRLNRLPTHSMAFVKSVQAPNVTATETRNRRLIPP